MALFFVDTGDGVEYHNTAEEARQSAEDWIGEYRTLPEWDEAVDRVCWGEVRQVATEVPKGEYVEYCLEDVKPSEFAGSNEVSRSYSAPDGDRPLLPGWEVDAAPLDEST